jgi:hypothetical protein
MRAKSSSENSRPEFFSSSELFRKIKDTLPGDQGRIMKRLHSILDDPESGAAMREDLQSGLHTLPAWMQRILRDLLSRGENFHELAE